MKRRLEEEYLVLSYNEVKAKYCIWEIKREVKEQQQQQQEKQQEKEEEEEQPQQEKEIEQQLQQEEKDKDKEKEEDDDEEEECNTDFKSTIIEPSSVKFLKNEYMEKDIGAILKCKPNYYLSSSSFSSSSSSFSVFDWDEEKTGFRMEYHPYLPLLLFYVKEEEEEEEDEEEEEEEEINKKEKNGKKE